MNKTFIIICSIAVALFFASCTEMDQPQSDKGLELKVNFTVNHAESSTKAVKSGWVSGDKLYVFLEEVTGLKYLILTNGGGGTKDWTASKGGSILDSDIAGASGKKIYAVYFPFDTPVIASDGASGVTFRSSGHTNQALNDLPIFSYYLTNGADGSELTSTVDGEAITLSGTLEMAIPEGFVQFFINKNGEHYASNDQYRLSVQGMKPVACSGYSGGSFTQTALLSGQPVWGYYYNNEGVAFSGVLNGSWSSSANHKFVLFNDEAGKSNDGIGKAYPAISKVYTLSLSSHDSKVFNPGIPGSLVNGWAQAVVTPSVTEFGGLKWGNWNLGATAVDGIGLYLQWGGLIEPEIYTYSYKNCRDYGDGSYGPIKSILGNNNLTGKYVIYDAARAYLGSGWRMPTKAEFDGFGDATIIDAGNTTTTVGPVYGTDPASYLTPSARKGAKFVSGTNSIFLPSSGYWQAADNTTASDNPKKCSYWTSTTKDLTNAYYMDVYTTTGYKERNGQYRAQGRQIRPIKVGD